MSEFDELKKRAGITEDNKASVVANNLINGNLSDAMHQVRGNVTLFAKTLLYLQEYDQEEMLRFIKLAARVR